MISLSSSGDILFESFDPGKRVRKLFIYVRRAVKHINKILQGLRIVRHIARFFLERALLGKKYPSKPSVMCLRWSFGMLWF